MGINRAPKEVWDEINAELDREAKSLEKAIKRHLKKEASLKKKTQPKKVEPPKASAEPEKKKDAGAPTEPEKKKGNTKDEAPAKTKPLKKTK